MRDYQIKPEEVEAILSLGYRVFIPQPGLTTYLVYSLNEKVAYLQNDNRGLCISSIHKPTSGIGSGFGILVGITITKENLDQGFAFAPHWANDSDRAAVIKWPSVEAYIKKCADIRMPLREIFSTQEL